MFLNYDLGLAQTPRRNVDFAILENNQKKVNRSELNSSGFVIFPVKRWPEAWHPLTRAVRNTILCRRPERRPRMIVETNIWLRSCRRSTRETDGRLVVFHRRFCQCQTDRFALESWKFIKNRQLPSNNEYIVERHAIYAYHLYTIVRTTLLEYAELTVLSVSPARQTTVSIYSNNWC